MKVVNIVRNGHILLSLKDLLMDGCVVCHRVTPRFMPKYPEEWTSHLLKWRYLQEEATWGMFMTISVSVWGILSFNTYFTTTGFK